MFHLVDPFCLFFCWYSLIRDSNLACDGHAFGVLNAHHGNPLCAMCQIGNDEQAGLAVQARTLSPDSLRAFTQRQDLYCYVFFFCTMGVVIGV